MLCLEPPCVRSVPIIYNYWLFLLPVYAIAGLLLVLALFVLNLTVVDGDIYGFIAMVNR